jgi:hypothetical protein
MGVTLVMPFELVKPFGNVYRQSPSQTVFFSLPFFPIKAYNRRMSRTAAATEAQKFGFAAALRAYLARANLTQEKLRQLLADDGFDVGQGTMSKWTLGKATPPNATVEAIEHHLDLVPGVLSRHLGWLPLSSVDLGPDVETAILADERLTPDQREVLLATYRALVGIQPRAKPVGQLQKRD